MDSTICNVIYVDRAVRQERLIRPSDDKPLDALESPSLEENVSLLLDVFGHGMFCVGPAPYMDGDETDSPL